MPKLRNPLDWLTFLLITNAGMAILLVVMILSLLVAVFSTPPMKKNDHSIETRSDTIMISDTENCRAIKQENNTVTFVCDIVAE
jgi:hypothetical protein